MFDFDENSNSKNHTHTCKLEETKNVIQLNQTVRVMDIFLVDVSVRLTQAKNLIISFKRCILNLN